MYSRRVGDEVLSFGHQGALYRKSFVMYDRQSESLWVHVSGQAIKGERKGQQLEFVASQIMPWQEWQRRYPLTKVLLGEKVDGFMGTFTLSKRMNEFGLSVGDGCSVTLLAYTTLEQVPVLNFAVAKQPVVAAFDTKVVRATAYSRVVGDRILNFEAILLPENDGSVTGKALKRDTLMRDSQTGGVWQRLTGTCIAGMDFSRRRGDQTADGEVIQRQLWIGAFDLCLREANRNSRTAGRGVDFGFHRMHAGNFGDQCQT